MRSRSWYIPRRTFLTGMGACIGLPFFDAMVPRKAHAATSPQRLLLMWHPNGYPTWPVTGAGYGVSRPPNPAFPGAQMPMELASQFDPVKEYVSFVEGLSFLYYRERNGSSPNHCGFVEFYTGKVARGADVITNGIVEQGTDPKKMGISLDQIIVRQAPRAKSLINDIAISPAPRYYVDENPAICFNAASWRGPDDPVAPISSPAALFKKLFSGTALGVPDPAAEQLERDRLTKGRLVLDGVVGEIKSLRVKLGREDGKKLDQYLTGVEELDRKTMSILAGEKIELACKPPAAPLSASTFAQKMTAFQDLTVKMFECDVARVATFMHSAVAAFGTPPFIELIPDLEHVFQGKDYGTTDTAWHPMSHHDTPYGSMAPDKALHRRNFLRVTAWNYGQVAALAAKMKATVMPGGENLLDSTLISWGGGMSIGDDHYHGRLVHTLIGRGGGAFKTGLKIPSPPSGGGDKSLMNLWVTVLQGFGIPATKFGEDSTGNIPALLA